MVKSSGPRQDLWGTPHGFISSDNSSPHPLNSLWTWVILLLGISGMENLHTRSSTFLAEFLSSGLWSDLMYLHASEPIVFTGFQLLLPKQTVLERFYAGLTWSENQSRTLSCNCWSQQILVLLYMYRIILQLRSTPSTPSMVLTFSLKGQQML